MLAIKTDYSKTIFKVIWLFYFSKTDETHQLRYKNLGEIQTEYGRIAEKQILEKT